MIELALLIKVGQYIGVFPTIILVALTGIIGVTLAKNQGFMVINKVKTSINRGQMPADGLIEGLLILIGGAMLLTPGLLTDATGFCMIIPWTRELLKDYLKGRLRKYLNKINIHYSNQSYNKDYYDIDSDTDKTEK
jgi:UPF0716 protein FxsA